MKNIGDWRIGVAALAVMALCVGCGGDTGNGDAVAAKTEAKPYTLETCIVSGEKLGSMGAPVVRVHEGQEVKFCCESCIEDFEKEPAKFLAKLAK